MTIPAAPVDLVKSLLKRLPPIRGLIADRDSAIKAAGIVPPGHFYSPIVSIDEARRDAERIFRDPGDTFPGIDLNEAEQLDILSVLEGFYEAVPFSATKVDAARYSFENRSYSYSDAIVLYGMMRHLRPARIIEVGSGHSSCAMMDVNDRFFSSSIDLTFIDPYPQLLESLIGPDEQARTHIVPSRLQDVDLSIFGELAAGDILFIDSTHVSKTGSDVNRLFFEVLPSLASGVYIHIHDVFFPFEYPQHWVFGGFSWNELYVLRAFLQYNERFRIVFMNTFMEVRHAERFRQRMPLCLKNPGGSIWLRKQ